MTVSKHVQAVASLAETATATLTLVGDSVISADQTVVLIDAAGTSVTYTAKGSADFGDQEFAATSETAISAATSLAGAIVHANGHNGTITVSRSDAVLTLTQATAGAAGNTLIVHNLTGVTASSYHGAYGFTGGEVGGADNNGGVIANAGTLAGLNRQVTSKTILSLVQGADSSGSKPFTVTGTAHRPGVQAALAAGGTFGYTPKRADRSSTDVGFVMKFAPSLLSGKAATSDFMAFPASDYGRRLGNVHPKVNTYQKGTWATQIFNLFASAVGGVTYPGHTSAVTNNDSGLRQSDGTVKAGITSRGSSLTFKNIRGSGYVDDSAQPAGGARAIPGELVMLFNFVDWGRTTSPNLIDYSAITG